MAGKSLTSALGETVMLKHTHAHKLDETIKKWCAPFAAVINNSGIFIGLFTEMS